MIDGLPIRMTSEVYRSVLRDTATRLRYILQHFCTAAHLLAIV